MAPRKVRAGQDQQIRLFKVIINAGHGVGAEGPFMPRHGRGHTQTRVRVDIGRAHEPFDQLVRDVIVLGQQLTRDIERDAIWSVFLDRFGKPVRNKVQRAVPRGIRATDLRVQQPPRQGQRIAQRRALGTQATLVRGVIGIAFDRQAALSIIAQDDATTDAAIGAGRFDRRGG